MLYATRDSLAAVPDAFSVYRLTVSIQRSPDLRHQLAVLYDAWTYLYQSKYWLSHILGGCRRLHVARRPNAHFFGSHLDSIVIGKSLDAEPLRDLLWKRTRTSRDVWVQRMALTDSQICRRSDYVLHTPFIDYAIWKQTTGADLERRAALLIEYDRASRSKRKVMFFDHWSGRPRKRNADELRVFPREIEAAMAAIRHNSHEFLNPSLPEQFVDVDGDDLPSVNVKEDINALVDGSGRPGFDQHPEGEVLGSAPSALAEDRHK